MTARDGFNDIRDLQRVTSLNGILNMSYTLLTIRVQRIQFIGYRSLKYHNNLKCTLNRVHDF